MGRYTILDDPKIDRRLDRDFNAISDALTREFPQVRAIVLVGGFGRGEGSVLVDAERVQPINDYDFIVIADNVIAATQLEELRPRLAEMVGVRQVDLSFVKTTALRHLRPKMGVYDLKYASTVLRGDPALLDEIPAMTPSDLSFVEGRVTILLYLISLLQAYPLRGAVSRERKFWIRQQISKSIIGWTTAHLVVTGAYVASYRRRRQAALNHFAGDAAAARLISFAYDFKLQPNFLDGDDPADLWWSAQEYYKKATRSFFERIYRREFPEWPRLVRRDRLNWFITTRLLYSSVLRKGNFARSQALNRARLFLCASATRGTIDEILLARANAELKCVDEMWTAHRTWEQVLVRLLELDPDCKYFYRGGEAVFLEAPPETAVVGSQAACAMLGTVRLM